jgi:hypothetical protein
MKHSRQKSLTFQCTEVLFYGQNSATGRMNTCLLVATDVRFQSPAARSVRHSAIDNSFNDDISQLDMDKDSIIFSLQVCMNRRRKQLCSF